MPYDDDDDDDDDDVDVDNAARLDCGQQPASVAIRRLDCICKLYTYFKRACRIHHRAREGGRHREPEGERESMTENLTTNIRRRSNDEDM